MSKLDIDQARGRGLSHQEQDALLDELEAARGVVRAADELQSECRELVQEEPERVELVRAPTPAAVRKVRASLARYNDISTRERQCQ